MINTGIYIRVSTEEQANNGYSIRAQEEKLKSYASIKDWNVFSVYIDEGISGKNIVDRKELRRLIDDIKENKINNVLVYKIDRLTRSTKDLIDLIDIFNKYNCSFNSLNESIDTKTSTGRMFIKIIGIFAEFERENIVERVKLGLERKVKEGYTIASKNISYGYVKEKGRKIQKVNKEESIIVNKVFDLFLKGYSYTKIANILNDANILTKNKYKWSYKTIKLLLLNPNYIGNVRYGINSDRYFETKGKHIPIVNINKYLSVQEKIKSYRKNKSLFKVRCACGNLMKVKKTYYLTKNNKNKVYVQYFCNCCNSKSISETLLKKKILCMLKIDEKDNYKFICAIKNIKELIVSDKNIKEILYYS